MTITFGEETGQGEKFQGGCNCKTGDQYLGTAWANSPEDALNQIQNMHPCKLGSRCPNVRLDNQPLVQVQIAV